MLPTMSERLRRLRDEWQHCRSAEAKSLFAEMPESERSAHIERFEQERLPNLALPIAKAWRRDGIQSRIAASSFHRWLTGAIWPGEVTDKQLLEFAVSKSPK